MRRKRVAGRFYLFVAIVLVVAFLIVRPHLSFFGAREDVIFTSTASYEQVMDCVIIRDEAVTTAKSTVRVEYIAHEATLVSSGETIANLFTTGYTESLLTRLETTRQNIQTYHKQLLGTIVDSALERLDTIIDMTALDFKNLATQQTRGSLQGAVEQLKTAMVNRQEYLRQNKRDDTKLTKLYEEENARLNSIQSWRKTSEAEDAGVVSFYLDGYESDLSTDAMELLSPSDIRSVLAGHPLAHTQDLLNDGIYRIVHQDNWYVAVLVTGNTASPVTGDTYYLQFEGFEDLRFTATTTNVQKTDGTVLAIFKIVEPVGPMLYQRTGKVTLGRSLSSLAVHSHALSNQEGQVGVWLYDIPGGTFVPVEVLYRDGNTAYIQPLVEGALQSGQRILIK